jgi:Kef-type K+ transport system membrane component KefB
MQFHFPSFPLSDPVLVFALAMAIFLVLPQLFERIRIPGLIGLIIAGAVIGPSGFGLLDRDATIVLLGTVGLLYLMFLVGLELDLNEFNRHRRHSVTFGVLSFLLPQVTGTALSLLLGYSLLASVLLGAMFASHTLVAYPIASRLGIVKTGAVTTVLGATLITDMLALLVLAVVTGAYEGETDAAFWIRLLATLSIYVAIVMVLIPRLGRWFFRRVRSDGPGEYVFVLTVLFGFAGLAEMVGIEPIIGALLVGFALNRLIPEQGPLMNRIKFVGDAIFVPFFLVSVGMLVDVRAFADRDAWLIIGALVFEVAGGVGHPARVRLRPRGCRRDVRPVGLACRRHDGDHSCRIRDRVVRRGRRQRDRGDHPGDLPPRTLGRRARGPQARPARGTRALRARQRTGTRPDSGREPGHVGRPVGARPARAKPGIGGADPPAHGGHGTRRRYRC